MLFILNIVISISVSIINMNNQGVIISIYINNNIIILFILNLPAAIFVIFIIFIIFILPTPAAMNINNNNIIILSVSNTAIPIIIYNKSDTVVILIFSVITVFPNTSTHNKTNINNEIIIMFILKIAISVINISVKSYKCKTIILPVIIIAINSILTTSLKNYKYKTVKIIIIINISSINNNIITLFILNFNLKVAAVFLLKKCKQYKLFILNIKILIKLSVNIIIINL